MLRSAFLAPVGALAVVACGGGEAGLQDSPVAPVADTRVYARQVDALVQPLVEHEWIVGASVALVVDDRVEYYGYGSTGGTRLRTPDADTIYEIGAVTKVFTGVLLAEQSIRGGLALETPLSELVPAGVRVPAYGDAPITLEQLATHTSGLPDLPDDLAGDFENPFGDYTLQQAFAYLSRADLTGAPGARYQYSDFAVGLLGEVIAARAGTDYEQLVRQRIGKPLGMNDTVVTLDDDQSKRLAGGHDDEATPVRSWSYQSLAGTGALRSTAHDLATFLLANFELPHRELGQALKLAQRPRHPVPSIAGHVGLGWHIGASGTSLWHNGQTGGYHSFVAFDAERRVGVVVLSNSATGTVDLLGAALALMVTGQPYSLELPETVVLSDEQLDHYVGSYQLSDSMFMSVTRDDDRLYAQPTGKRRRRIYPRTDSEFYFRAVDATVTFTFDGPRVIGLELRSQQQTLAGRRL